MGKKTQRRVTDDKEFAQIKRFLFDDYNKIPLKPTGRTGIYFPGRKHRKQLMLNYHTSSMVRCKCCGLFFHKKSVRHHADLFSPKTPLYGKQYDKWLKREIYYCRKCH